VEIKIEDPDGEEEDNWSESEEGEDMGDDDMDMQFEMDGECSMFPAPRRSLSTFAPLTIDL